LAATGTQNAAHVRSLIRQGLWTHHTSGLADEHVQGNVVILPEAQANDFLRYCQRNPKPCPLLAVSEPGHALLPTLGRTSTSAPTCRATACGATASWWTSPATSAACGATTW
jgi:uncharacterized protein YcsI (UPF0317 family)